MGEQLSRVSTLDRAAIALTQLAGVLTVALSVWGLWVDPITSPLWTLGWAALGSAIALLYTPALRLGAIVCLGAAALSIVALLSPFSMMDAAPAALEKPDFVSRRITVVLGLSALFVALAFCLERARRVRRALRAPARSNASLSSAQAEPASLPPPR